MKTAIVTGASSGLGREFVRQLEAFFPEIERYWLIARRRERLEELAETLAGKSVRILPLDLCDAVSFAAVQAALAEERPEIVLLINNAGCGYLGNVGALSVSAQTRMTDLNVRAVTAVTAMVLPYMPAGGRILNVSSIAAFCPTPRMTVYSATKAYVSAFTRGLAEEVRETGVSVTAVCPGPMATEFEAAGGADASRKFMALPFCDQVRVVRGALRACRDGRRFYTPTALYRAYRLAAKVLPHALLVKAARL